MMNKIEKIKRKIINNLNISKKLLSSILDIEDKKSFKINQKRSFNKSIDLHTKYDDDLNLIEAVTKRGKDKSQDVDSYSVVIHPNNKDFKLLVVTEGRGRVLNDDEYMVTSQYLTKKIEDCFKSFDNDTLNQFSSFKFNIEFSNCLKKANRYLKKSFGDNSCKIIAALIGPRDTYVFNFGNLRCYISEGLKIAQLNEEDSEMWKVYQMGYMNKEELRFHKNRNGSVKTIGTVNDECVEPSNYILDNDKYDRLFLFSHGVSDCISDYRLNDINRESSPDEIVKVIIDICTDNSKENLISSNDKYYSQYGENIHGAKDSTVCMLVKK